ncbi:Uncharacterised protein [Vibrio cholerae]|nr:Uncharacterised protein [Vibrio cholerae]
MSVDNAVLGFSWAALLSCLKDRDVLFHTQLQINQNDEKGTLC